MSKSTKKWGIFFEKFGRSIMEQVKLRLTIPSRVKISKILKNSTFSTYVLLLHIIIKCKHIFKLVEPFLKWKCWKKTKNNKSSFLKVWKYISKCISVKSFRKNLSLQCRKIWKYGPLAKCEPIMEDAIAKSHPLTKSR